MESLGEQLVGVICKFERKTNSKLYSYIDCWWFFISTIKNQPTKVECLFLATFRVLLSLKKKNYRLFRF